MKMANPNEMSPAELKAYMSGDPSGWGEWGSSDHHARYCEPIYPRSRRHCHCCRRRATHAGMANGVSLIHGCEFLVLRWVRSTTLSLKCC